jgi:eukaryotic translation initiation factor 2C
MSKGKEKDTQTEIKNEGESLEPVPILKRDGFGEEGRPITVKANSFKVTSKISKYDRFHKYTLEIKPVDTGKNIEADIKRERSDYGKNIRRRVLKELGLKKEEWFKDVVIAYDGGTALYTTNRLGFDKETDATEVKEEISLNDFQDLDGKPTRYSVTISRTDTTDTDGIELTKLEKYVSGEEFEWDFFSDEGLNVLNALIHQTAAEKYIQSGSSSIYDKSKKKKIFGGIELWSGWFSTVRPGQGSLFVNVNPTYTTFYQPLKLDEFLIQYLNTRNRTLPNTFEFQQQKKINEILGGLLVRPLHLKNVQVERRIKSLLPATKVAQFKYKPNADSEEIPLEKYFRDNHQLKGTKNLFVQIKGDEDTNIAWPVEFCQIVEGQRFSNKKLSGRQRAEIILAARMKPSVNESETIRGAKEILQLQSDPTGVGLEVAPDLVKVDARILESTKVKYAETVLNPKNGQWNLRDVKFVSSGEPLNSWQVVVFEDAKWMPKNEVNNFIRKLITQCKTQGMNVSEDMPDVRYYNTQRSDLVQSVKKAYEDAKTKLNRPPQMILFIIPGEKAPNNINTRLYETIKRVMDTQIGCLSQCVKVDSRRNFNNPQYCANLSMKMNLKLGGINSNLPEDELRLPSKEDVLFLGADVTHPKEKDDPSICAVVGSLDGKGARYITKYQTQERSGKEEIQKIDIIITEILKEYCDYQKKNRAEKDITSLLPPCIIMYRDGVSESQFERVLRLELPKIKEACAKFQTNYQPKIIFAVVGKRHHTRLFPENPRNKQEADKNGNCLVGTVADKTITHPTLNDFYLQSQYANQGTARPSHYTILYDDVKLTPDQFQSLSNALCYNFQRTTSSVSIPAPTYYAHLTCARAKMYHQRGKELPSVHQNLKNYPMYFM